MSKYILAIDQGTTSSRAILFDLHGNPKAIKQKDFKQYFPADGWVEHDATEIWNSTLLSCRAVMTELGASAKDIACIGITNQRETSVVWDRRTGEPLNRAIVWQDRRTADLCDSLREKHASNVQEKTGLLLDPYFSATKFRWLLENVPEAREKALAGHLAIGTIDTYLLWKLTSGKSYYTDITNASRTMLFNIKQQSWDIDLLNLFEIPRDILPEVKDCGADFGMTDESALGGSIPITGMIGDQQAASFGQCCFEKGQAKATYGTGGFLLFNTGNSLVYSSNRLLTTIAYRLDGATNYAIEGSIFMAGATMQWLRDQLKLLQNAADSEKLAREVSDDLKVYLVPAFTGLGAPYWDPQARGALFGMTRDTGINELAAAGLMSTVYQTKDLMDAIKGDGATLAELRVDGGLSTNNYFNERLADVLNCEVHRPIITETTALGAAYVAGLQGGVFSSLDQINKKWQVDMMFKPKKDDGWRERQYAGWKNAVERTKS
tara:strand:- start:1013 stop:2488 length:1476 start_codon:yes stop_codon:yes gene_type:complete